MATLFKDLFSKQASFYIKYRPTYPPKLFQFLANLNISNDLAWDVGAGSGQASRILSQFYKKVIATEPSPSQLEPALKTASQYPNISFLVGKAEDKIENSSIPLGKVDLICIAQAIHWFDFEKFYKQVKRAAKPKSEGGSLIAAITYVLPSFPKENKNLDDLLLKYYDTHLAGCWDAKRKLVDEKYSTIPWPFEAITHPITNEKTNFISDFETEMEWDALDFLGYLRTWSATQTKINNNLRDNFVHPRELLEGNNLQHFFEEERSYSPLTLLEKELIELWPGLKNSSGPNGKGEKLRVAYPVYVKIGRVYFEDD
ncbi:hypothetical protein HK099_004722 [Clydaea vesicula]|uniref:Methyltransferase type 11 domain-containing protein n=1 Tax=Clydaea vesicula TaxID=447962 RepID=A0AAD5TZY3_9FUNG|nr:hypothetical protein HK099_004722 [Clydaea vesicula]KAJ3382389.1 hypothetical protein HDU92_004782 [Lobulomyces angularis]